MKRAALAFSLAGVIAGTASATIFVPPPAPIPDRPSVRPAKASDLSRSSPQRVAETRQAPVPTIRPPKRNPVRQVEAAPPSQETASASTPGLSEAAAKAAIEADGYKAVRALAAAPQGRWTARASRGQTEIGLTVEPDGSVRAN
jgi:hypothetical protein